MYDLIFGLDMNHILFKSLLLSRFHTFDGTVDYIYDGYYDARNEVD